MLILSNLIEKLVNYLDIYGTPRTQFADLPLDMQREILLQGTKDPLPPLLHDINV